MQQTELWAVRGLLIDWQLGDWLLVTLVLALCRREAVGLNDNKRWDVHTLIYWADDDELATLVGCGLRCTIDRATAYAVRNPMP